MSIATASERPRPSEAQSAIINTKYYGSSYFATIPLAPGKAIRASCTHSEQRAAEMAAMKFFGVNKPTWSSFDSTHIKLECLQPAAIIDGEWRPGRWRAHKSQP